jgi:hypothetical protein
MVHVGAGLSGQG